MDRPVSYVVVSINDLSLSFFQMHLTAFETVRNARSIKPNVYSPLSTGASYTWFELTIQ